MSDRGEIDDIPYESKTIGVLVVSLCDPMDCSPPGFSVHGILQARTLEWVAIPFSRGSSQPRDRNWVSLHCRQTLYCLSYQGSLHPLYAESKRNDRNELTKQKQTHRPWEGVYGCWWVGVGEGIQGVWMDMSTLLCLNWKPTKPTVEHIELCSMFCGSLDGRGVWQRMDTCACMTESLLLSPETITTLLIGYTPIQNKTFKKYWNTVDYNHFCSTEALTSTNGKRKK